MNSVPFARDLAAWTSSLSFADIPQDVITATKLRVMDIVGLALAGAQTDLGRATRDAAVALSPPGPSHILGTGEGVGIGTAALANGTFSQALEYDDSHLESIVHMSSPAVATALAIADRQRTSGRDLLTAIALGNEVSCRVGSVAPGQFYRRGFHPTGIFAAFGATCLAARLFGLDSATTSNALGTCGSFASGILECWVDGTDSKFLHAGWSAQAGITAALLARAGASGPATVFEGRFGFFASHLQNPEPAPSFDRLTRDLGRTWESRNASFKPFPAAHVIHPYIDAILQARARHGIRPGDVQRIDCPVASYIVGIVCEPAEEKCAPATPSHCRVSLPFTLAEALVKGSLGRNAYADSLRDPETLALARRVHYHVDPSYPGPGRFKGSVTIALTDGRTLTEVVEHSRGSAGNPMTVEDLRAKFDENASGFLDAAGREELAATIARLDTLPDASAIVRLATRQGAGSAHG